MLAFAVSTLYIATILDRLDRGSIGRGTADAELFHLAHHRSLRVAGRALCEALFPREGFERKGFALLDCGEELCHLCIAFLSRRLHIDIEEASEGDHFALCGEGIVRTRDGDRDGRALDLCVRHLRGEGTLADQVIETLLLSRTTDTLAVDIGGTNSFVSLLRTLALGLEAAGLVVFLPRMLLDLTSDSAEGLRREVDRVGTHIGDMPRFVEGLCEAHRLRDGVAELVCGLLLQRRCGEGSCWRAASCTARDRTDREVCRSTACHEGLSLSFGSEAMIELCQETLTRGEDEGRL